MTPVTILKFKSLIAPDGTPGYVTLSHDELPQTSNPIAELKVKANRRHPTTFKLSRIIFEYEEA